MIKFASKTKSQASIPEYPRDDYAPKHRHNDFTPSTENETPVSSHTADPPYGLDMLQLEAELSASKLTRIANIVSTLTYGEIVQLFNEMSIMGKLSEQTIWDWGITRKKAGDRAEEVFNNIKTGESKNQEVINVKTDKEKGPTPL